MKTVPYKHQRDILDHTWNREFHALFMDQGTGKTKITIDTFERLYLTDRIDCMIVVAPNGVQSNWVNTEIPKHSGSIEAKGCHIWRGLTTKKERDEITGLFRHAANGGAIVLALNVEALRIKRCFDLVLDFLKRYRCLMVVDESTIIKNPSAQQTKAALRLGWLAKYRRILTGTPMAQSPLDVYSQMLFLDPEIWPHGSFTAFRSDFAIEELANTAGNRKFRKITGYRNQDKLQKLIAPYAIRITKEECLDLPPKVYVRRDVELTLAQKQAYENMIDEAMTMINEGLVTASNTLSLLQKLHRISLGHVKTDEGAEYEIHTNRLDIMRAVIDEIGPKEKVIIWAHYKIDIQRIKRFLSEEMKGAPLVYYGNVDQAGRTSAIQAFQEDPKRRFFVANKAASRGLTLTAASCVIYYSNSYSLEDRLQSEDRCHRIGQEKHVVYHDLIARETVDEKVFEALGQKRSLSAEIMKGVTTLKDLIKSGPSE